MWMILAELIVLMGSVYHIMSVLFNDKENLYPFFFSNGQRSIRIAIDSEKDSEAFDKSLR